MLVFKSWLRWINYKLQVYYFDCLKLCKNFKMSIYSISVVFFFHKIFVSNKNLTLHFKQTILIYQWQVQICKHKLILHQMWYNDTSWKKNTHIKPLHHLSLLFNKYRVVLRCVIRAHDNSLNIERIKVQHALNVA